MGNSTANNFSKIEFLTICESKHKSIRNKIVLKDVAWLEDARLIFSSNFSDICLFFPANRV